MKKLLYIFVVFASLSIVSCKTDIDANAEYQDITVVYGLIDPADSVHYVKITKAFLGEANALDLAADANNFNYEAGELEVTIEALSGGVVVGTNVLTRTVNELPKDTGTFDNTNNVLYKFVEPNIGKYNTYRLKIHNVTLDKDITSETFIVKGADISTPSVGQKLAFWIGPVSSPTSVYVDRDIEIVTRADMGRMDATVVFNYTDNYTTASGLAPVLKSVRMFVGEVETIGNEGGESLTLTLKGATFFENVVANVPSQSTIPFFSHRELVNVSMEFNVAGTELSTYMLVTEPSTSINQNKPNYTNVENGLGIFSSRTVLDWISSIDPAAGQVNLSPNTVSKLHSLGLGFCFGTSPTSLTRCNQLP